MIPAASKNATHEIPCVGSMSFGQPQPELRRHDVDATISRDVPPIGK